MIFQVIFEKKKHFLCFWCYFFIGQFHSTEHSDPCKEIVHFKGLGPELLSGLYAKYTCLRQLRMAKSSKFLGFFKP